MATVSGSLWGKDPEMGLWLNLPPAGDLEGYYQDVTSLQRFKRGRGRYGNISCFPFKMNINGVLETFEWKTTHGKERRRCGGSWSYPAYALVRITNYSRDGGQIVAVVNHTRRAFKITFCGMGLIGVFGKRWEAMVAATGFTLWLVNSVADAERATAMMAASAYVHTSSCS
ncbi:hypothetical protein CKAH01_07081 [Colletotrichum kahawae]|uniref:Uncharacterized protein n=1 Tax=Colletotrichum kahawae TaxID=34407 RepID=A0AAE0D1G2_COLKA|nr:hypothetical protein CKAH01_07081 [Colletotrichum kahawae]